MNCLQVFVFRRKRGAVALIASVLLLALAASSLVKAQGRLDAIDAGQIVASSIDAGQRHWRARLTYTYMERNESRHRDLTGHVKSEDIDIWRILLVNGLPYRQLIERNGRPPSAALLRKHEEDRDKLKRDTPAQRSQRLRRREAETASLVQELPKAFDFQATGEATIGGRPAYVIFATPHSGYRPQGKYGKVFSRVSGTLWIDKQDFGLVKVDGQVIEPFSLGVFLARVLRGASIRMEQTRVDDIWLPARVEIQAAAKILFLKNLTVDRVLAYSEYRAAKCGLADPAGREIP